MPLTFQKLSINFSNFFVKFDLEEVKYRSKADVYYVLRKL